MQTRDAVPLALASWNYYLGGVKNQAGGGGTTERAGETPNLGRRMGGAVGSRAVSGVISLVPPASCIISLGTVLIYEEGSDLPCVSLSVPTYCYPAWQKMEVRKGKPRYH